MNCMLYRYLSASNPIGVKFDPPFPASATSIAPVSAVSAASGVLTDPASAVFAPESADDLSATEGLFHPRKQ